MTMEVLEGQDLASFIRKLPADGLAPEQCMPYIEQLCAGLSYAHEAELVHSDLKPGNCFITSEGRIKLLDFGIARASKTKADASGETTVFDPGELGALTLTYATIEMFDGQDPDPRDDIYALAIMSYQLLTGKHPYRKLSAKKAMEQKLTPAPIDKLNKRQNRALQRGLAFLREHRTPTVADFLDELRPKKSYVWHFSTAAVLVMAIIGGLAYQPIKQYLLEQQMEEAIAAIQAGDNPQGYATAVQALEDRFPGQPEAIRGVLEDERVKRKLIDEFGQQAENAVADSNEFANYQAAEDALGVVKQWYPDSAEALIKINAIQRQKDDELSLLNAKYNELLDTGLLIPLPGEDDITDNAFDQANQLLQASVAYAPDDPALSNLRYQVETELKRRQNAIVVAQIQKRLESRGQSFSSLADFQPVRDDLIALADLDPGNELLRSMQETLKQTFTQELTQSIDRQSWDDAEQLLVAFSRLLEMPFLIDNRSLLSQAEAQAGYEIAMTDERQAAVEERKTQVDALLGDPKFTREWEMALRAPYQELVALLPANHPDVAPLRDTTARLYLEKASESRSASRFGEAAAFVEKGANFYPNLVAFSEERNAIAAAEETFKLQQEEERRLARVKKLKVQIIADANADKPQLAVKGLREVESELETDDAFLTSEAPQAIALSYQRLAAQQAQQSNWENAAKFAQAGVSLAPDLAGLKEALAEYNQEVAKIASIINLKKQLTATRTLDFSQIKKQLALIKSEFPDKWEGLIKEYNTLAQRRLKALEKEDIVRAHQFRESAKAAFPFIAKVKLKPLPSKLVSPRYEGNQRGPPERRSGHPG